MRHANIAALVLLPLLASCVLSGSPISPYGRPATINGRNVGELLAVRADSIWLLESDAVRVYAVAEITDITVQRHTFDGRRSIRLVSLTGLATGIALTASCFMYESRENSSGSGACVAVTPVVTGVFSLIGGIFAWSNNRSSEFYFSARDSARLRAYARFPQGMPPGFTFSTPAAP